MSEFRIGHGRCMMSVMEIDEAARTMNGARGYAELGMYQDAWEAVESLPPSLR